MLDWNSRYLKFAGASLHWSEYRGGDLISYHAGTSSALDDAGADLVQASEDSVVLREAS